jgi:hypothetical protein
VIRCLFAALALSLLGTGLRGETYEQWETSAPNQLSVPFKNWLPPGTNISNDNGDQFSVFESPLGHLFGYLDLSAFPPSEFPLKVGFHYSHIEASAVNSTPNGDRERVPSWDTPIGYLAHDAPLGKRIEDREIEVKNADEARAVPVWSVFAQDNREVDDGPFNAYSVLLEVKGQDGIPLVRKRLIEAVAGATTRNAGLARNNSGAEDYFKSFVDVTMAYDLPVEESVYRDVKVLWLDDDSLRDARYTDSFWRKVFLGGTMVLGHTAEVEELAQRLEILPNERILEGGLWSVDYPAVDFSDLVKGAQGQYDLHLKKGENPFQRQFVLGRKRTNELRRFSIWFLVTFTLFEIAVIVGSLFWLRGYRRVFRWLLIPLSAIAYTALGLIIVHGVVDFRPEVQMIQEVDSVEGWPESLVSTDVTRLSFEDGRASFNSPAPAELSWFAIDANTSPVQSEPADDKTLFSMHQRYGRFSSMSVQYWVPGNSPCEMTANRGIVATRPLRGAWIWDGRVWRNLGPMRPGQPVSIDQARIVVNPSDVSGDGVPSDSQYPYQNQGFLPDTVSQMCVLKYMKSLENTDVGILLAIDEQAAPDQVLDAAVSEVHTQTLLVHQFKLSSLKP